MSSAPLPPLRQQPRSSEELSRYAMDLYLASDDARRIGSRMIVRRTRKSTAVLRLVAVGQTLIAVTLSLVPHLAGPVPSTHAAVERAGLAALFWVLVAWSRLSPLTPAVIGLTVYVALWVKRGIGMGLPHDDDVFVVAVGSFVRLMITAGLVRAVVVGLQHRKYMQHKAAL